MSYLSLYRRWRPRKFEEVTAQPHITRTLSHALSRESISHAYLFCGPRGTGKTTVAKILAKAINCTCYPALEPCNECRFCLSISNGTSMDVVELDAASNRGIEEIRELKERLKYASTEGGYKVYIIDEAHMLTPEAFNALLKTLEEPPAGVVFILATTEPSRLPSTVISRCQRFDFRLLKEEEIVGRLQEVAAAENWKCDSKALSLIARLSDGAMRDALSILEQAQVYAEDEITENHVYDLTGLPAGETLNKLVEALVEEEVQKGLEAVREVTYGGKDINLFVKEQLYFFTQLLIVASSDGGTELGENSFYNEYLSVYRDRISRDSLLEIISILHQLSTEIKFFDNPHFNLEVAFFNMLKALRLKSSAPAEHLAERLEYLEQKVELLMQKEPEKRVEESGEARKPAAPELEKPEEEKGPPLLRSPESEARSGEESEIENKMQEQKVEKEERERQQTGEKSSKAAGWQEESGKPVDFDSGQVKGTNASYDLQHLWDRVIKALQKNKQKLLLGMLQDAKPVEFKNNVLVIAFGRDNKTNKEMVMNRRGKLEETISHETGENIKIKCVVLEEKSGITGEQSTAKGNCSGETGSLAKSVEPEEEKSGASADENPREDLVDEACRLFNGKPVELEE